MTITERRDLAIKLIVGLYLVLIVIMRSWTAIRMAI